MLSSKFMKETISSLKERLSKILTLQRKLSEEELIALEGVYFVIDDIILWDKKLTKNKATRFKTSLKKYSSLIEGSNRAYIQKNINPLITKILERDWES